MQLPLYARRIVVGAVAALLAGMPLGMAGLARAGDTGPTETVPAGSPPPSPDPAPPPSPGGGGGPAGGGSSSSGSSGGGPLGGGSSGGSTYVPPSYTPPPSTQPAPSTPSAAQIRKQRQERLRKQRERERRAAELKRRREEAARLRRILDGVAPLGVAGAAFLAAPAPARAEPKPETAAPTPASQRIGQPQAAAPVRSFPSSNDSALSNAAPVLLGMFGLALVLLVLAAIPPWHIRQTQLAGLLAHRRVELGLIGTAVLAAAAIGLVIALLAG